MQQFRHTMLWYWVEIASIVPTRVMLMMTLVRVFPILNFPGIEVLMSIAMSLAHTYIYTAAFDSGAEGRAVVVVVGRRRRCAEFVVGVAAAVAVRHVVGWNDNDALVALVSCTAELHAMRKLLREAPDISFWDVILMAAMQVAFYQTFDDSIALNLLVLASGFSVVWYKYWSYSIPIVNVESVRDADQAQYQPDLEDGQLVCSKRS